MLDSRVSDQWCNITAYFDVELSILRLYSPLVANATGYPHMGGILIGCPTPTEMMGFGGAGSTMLLTTLSRLKRRRDGTKRCCRRCKLRLSHVRGLRALYNDCSSRRKRGPTYGSNVSSGGAVLRRCCKFIRRTALHQHRHRGTESTFAVS